MRYQSIDYGHSQVMAIITEAVEATKTALNIKMTPYQVIMLSDDIYDVYKNESIEEVVQCLKKGRQGAYSFKHNSRSSFSMLLVRDWMEQQLEIKAQAKERIHQSQKAENREVLEGVDYAAYKAKQAKLVTKKRKAVIINPKDRNAKYQDPNKVYQAIQAKLYQGQQLNDDELEFIRYHKLEVKDKVLHQKL